ncbi:MAG: hypothetical protein ABIS47_06390 [Acidimicrobiales bacterium]
MSNRTDADEDSGLPTARELAVLAVVLAMVAASILLLIIASGQVAAALTASG